MQTPNKSFQFVVLKKTSAFTSLAKEKVVDFCAVTAMSVVIPSWSTALKCFSSEAFV